MVYGKNKMPGDAGRFIVGVSTKIGGKCSMDNLKMLEKIREELQNVSNRCDELISWYQNQGEIVDSEPIIAERELAWTSPATFKGKKPVAVKFATGEIIETSTWLKLAQAILLHCNKQPGMHERLMRLRDKVAGRQRIILGSSAAGMDVPLKIDEDLFFEGKFDTESLMIVLTKRVLEPVGYDYSRIRIRYTSRKPMQEQQIDMVENADAEQESQVEQESQIQVM